MNIAARNGPFTTPFAMTKSFTMLLFSRVFFLCLHVTSVDTTTTVGVWCVIPDMSVICKQLLISQCVDSLYVKNNSCHFVLYHVRKLEPAIERHLGRGVFSTPLLMQHILLFPQTLFSWLSTCSHPISPISCSPFFFSLAIQHRM